MGRTEVWILGFAMAVGSPFVLSQCSSSGSSPSNGLPDSSIGSSGSGGSSGNGSSSGLSSSSSSSSSSGGASSSSSSSSGSSSSGGISSSGGNAGDGGDAASEGGGTDAAESGSSSDLPDGGLPSNPGVVPCGGDAGGCMTMTSACCAPAPPDGGNEGTCTPNAVSCGAGTSKVQCKEAADCPSGYICCENFPAIATNGPTSCMQSCSGGAYQICRRHGECAGNDSGAPAQCMPQTCTAPAGPGGGGGPTIVIEACALPPTMTGMGMMNSGALPYCTPN
jgi:hypothetical protein